MTPLKARRTINARRRAAGVIYIESLLVVAVLVVIFAATVFLGGAYKAKLSSFDFATAVAFRNAEKGCGPPLGGSYSIGALLAKAGTSTTHPDPSYLGGAVPAARGTASVPLGSDVLFGAKRWNFAADAQLLCNEVPITKKDAWAALHAKDWAVNGLLNAAGL